MDFTHTEDRRMLADMAGRFIRERYDIETRHKIAGMPLGFDREMWNQFAELGLIGALFGDQSGGFGGAGFDIAVLFEELGRGLVVEPFLATLLAGRLIADLGNDTQQALLGDIIAGRALVAFAHGEADSHYDLGHVSTTARRVGEGWIVNGHKAVVLNGDAADRIVVSARISGDTCDKRGIALFLLDPSAKGIDRRGYGTVDGYHACDITFTKVALGDGDLLGAAGEAFDAIERVTGLAALAVCAEALGAMQVATEMTLEYLKTRTQFGVPIGRFQVLQHRMAEMLIEIEQVRSAVINAAGHMEAPRSVREWHVSAAKNLVGRAGRLVAEETIQMHGGIGMTWEYALPHFAKRIVMIDHLFGDEDHHLERIVQFGAGA